MRRKLNLVAIWSIIALLVAGLPQQVSHGVASKELPRFQPALSWLQMSVPPPPPLVAFTVHSWFAVPPQVHSCRYELFALPLASRRLPDWGLGMARFAPPCHCCAPLPLQS